MNTRTLWFAERNPTPWANGRRKIRRGEAILTALGCCFLLLGLGCQPSDPETVAEEDSPAVTTTEVTTDQEVTDATESEPDPSAMSPSADSETVADAGSSKTAIDQTTLPKPPETGESEAPILDEDGDGLPDFVYDKPIGEELALKAFLPPPGAKALTKSGRLWVDPSKHRVYIDGYVTMNRGPLEMLACPVGTKEHESIIAALAKSREVHTALLAIGANPGTPVRFRPEFLPPTGQVVRTYVCWYDEEGEFKAVDARQWIKDLETQKAMTVEWVFAGSGFWQDPQDKREYYQADSGDMICVSNFSSAMMDVAIPSSADAGALRFETFESKIPELDTPVRLILIPVPEPTDDGEDTEETEQRLQEPTADDVPKRE